MYRYLIQPKNKGGRPTVGKGNGSKHKEGSKSGGHNKRKLVAIAISSEGHTEGKKTGIKERPNHNAESSYCSCVFIAF